MGTLYRTVIYIGLATMLFFALEPLQFTGHSHRLLLNFSFVAVGGVLLFATLGLMYKKGELPVRVGSAISATAALLCFLVVSTILAQRPGDSLIGFDLEPTTLVCLGVFAVIIFASYQNGQFLTDTLMRYLFGIMTAFLSLVVVSTVLPLPLTLMSSVVTAVAGTMIIWATAKLEFCKFRTISETAYAILGLGVAIASMLLYAPPYYELGLAVVAIFFLVRAVRSEIQFKPIFIVVLIVLLLSTGTLSIHRDTPNFDSAALTAGPEEIYGAALRLARRAPELGFTNFWLGWGPASFDRLFDLSRALVLADVEEWNDLYLPPYWSNGPKYSVSLVQTSALESGIFGVVLWLIWLTVVGMLWWRYLQKYLNRQDSSGEVSIALAAIAGVGLVNILLLPPNTLSLFLVALGVGWISYQTTPPTYMRKWLVESKVIYQRAALLIVLVIGVLILLGLACLVNVVGSRLLYYQAVEYYYSQNDFSAPYDQAKALMEAAIEKQPHPIYSRGLAQLSYIQIDRYLSRYDSLSGLTYEQQIIASLLSDSVAQATVATELDPHDYRNWVIRTAVYLRAYKMGSEQAPNLIQESALRATQLSATNPLPYYMVAQYAYIEGDIEYAQERIEIAHELIDNHEGINQLYIELLGEPPVSDE